MIRIYRKCFNIARINNAKIRIQKKIPTAIFASEIFFSSFTILSTSDFEMICDLFPEGEGGITDPRSSIIIKAIRRYTSHDGIHALNRAEGTSQDPIAQENINMIININKRPFNGPGPLLLNPYARSRENINEINTDIRIEDIIIKILHLLARQYHLIFFRV